MLYLHPPFHIIEGVYTLPDHSDPLQYYYMPAAPRLTMIEDSVTGERVPQILLIKYRGEAGNGGFLNFDVNLGIDDDKLDDVRRELRNRAGLDELPRLAPIPLVDGSVKLMMLGETSVPPADGGDVDDTGPSIFEVRISHHAKPALYGSNQAAFSVELDQEAITVMEQAIQGELAPIGVVYSLSYWALRPAYTVRVVADWDRVQTHFEEGISIDTIVFSAQIDEVVDKLIEDRVIQIDIDTFVPEGEDHADVISRRDLAIQQVREMVTDAFFEPSLDPIRDEPPDGWDRFTDTTAKLATIASAGGWAGAGSFSYRKSDITRIDKKSLNVNFRERTTVERKIYPQGHLSGLFRVLRDTGMDLDRFVMHVDLDDPWFKRRQVRVVSRANAEADQIASINAELRYGNEPKTVLLDAEASEGTVNWASLLDNNGQMRRPLDASYRVRFRDVDGAERPIKLEAPAQTIDTDVWEIDPRELYSVMTVPVVALNFPWSKYPHVEIRLRYEDSDNGIRMDDSLLLNAGQAEQLWKVFVRNPDKREFDYKLTYRAADHQDVESAWMTSGEERITLRDPYPNKRTLEIIPAVNWDEVNFVFVDVSYEDEANDVHEEQSFRFDRNAPMKDPFVVSLVDPNLRLVQYKVTILFTNGSMTEIPRSMTQEPRIFVRADMRGHRIVLVGPHEQLDFEGNRLKELRVELGYEDAENGISVNDEFRMTGAADRRYFEFDYVDPDRTSFQYRTRYFFTNGMNRSTDWQTVNTDELRVEMT